MHIIFFILQNNWWRCWFQLDEHPGQKRISKEEERLRSHRVLTCYTYILYKVLMEMSLCTLRSALGSQNGAVWDSGQAATEKSIII